MNRALSILVVLLFLVSAFPSPGFLGDSRPIEVSIGDGEGSVIEDASVTENLKALRAEIAHLEAEGFGEALDRVIDRTLALERQVLVFFYADWCHFCTLQKPVLDALEPAYASELVVLRVNEARDPAAIAAFAVTGYPTLLLIQGRAGDGYRSHRFTGFRDEVALDTLLTQAVYGDLPAQPAAPNPSSPLVDQHLDVDQQPWYASPNPSLTTLFLSNHTVINEVLFNPLVEDSGEEWIEILNPTNDTQSLSGWTIGNRQGVIATLPNWDFPNSTFLTVHFGNGTNDGNFTDGTGHFYTNTSTEVFNNTEDEVALYDSVPSPTSVLDFVSWSSNGAYSGGSAHDYAVSAGQWASGEYLDVNWTTNSVLDGESIGRNKHSEDMDIPSDWDDHGGTDAYFSTPGSPNTGPLFRVREGIKLTQTKINLLLIHFDFNITNANHTIIQEYESENETYVEANHHFVTTYDTTTVNFAGVGAFHWYAINASSWMTDMRATLSSDYGAIMTFNNTIEEHDLDALSHRIHETLNATYSTENDHSGYREDAYTITYQTSRNTLQTNVTQTVIDDAVIKALQGSDRATIHSDTHIEVWKDLETRLNTEMDTALTSHYNTYLDPKDENAFTSVFEGYTITKGNATYGLDGEGNYTSEKAASNGYNLSWNYRLGNDVAGYEDVTGEGYWEKTQMNGDDVLSGTVTYPMKGTQRTIQYYIDGEFGKVITGIACKATGKALGYTPTGVAGYVAGKIMDWAACKAIETTYKMIMGEDTEKPWISWTTESSPGRSCLWVSTGDNSGCLSVDPAVGGWPAGRYCYTNPSCSEIRRYVEFVVADCAVEGPNTHRQQIYVDIKGKSCDDDNPCTVDLCLPVEGAVFGPHYCVHEERICAQDNNPCTTNKCNATSGQCEETVLAGKKCSGQECTGDDCTGYTCCWRVCSQMGTCEDSKCSTFQTPGCDHPDDNYDVSSNPSNLIYPPTALPAAIGILSNGYAPLSTQFFDSLGEPISYLGPGATIEALRDYPVLVIPSGGLHGLDAAPSFNAKLEDYVNEGGTLIALAQGYGSMYHVLPGGEVSGYGWNEDQSCHHSSVYISTYHTILSGQDSVTLAVNVDGYFTGYPEGAAVLLSRTKNEQPAMLMYDHGEGTVIATTVYTDWAYSHGQATTDGQHLLRDLITWAKTSTEIPEYGPGDDIDIPLGIVNDADITVNTLNFTLLDPDKNVVDHVPVSLHLIPGAVETVHLNYVAPSKLGIWRIDYLLYSNSSVTQTFYDVRRFAVSTYTENPSGWTYHGRNVTFAVNSDREYYAYGSNGTFSFQIWNTGDAAENVTVRWRFPHNYWTTGDPLYTYRTRTVAVPAQGQASFLVSVPVYATDRLWASFTDAAGRRLGGASRGFFVFTPTVDLDVATDRRAYAKADAVTLSLTLNNTQPVHHEPTVEVRVLNPDNTRLYETSITPALNATSHANVSFEFMLPADAAYGVYLVTVDAYEDGEKTGTASTYFQVRRDFTVAVAFDQPESVYQVRQHLGLQLTVTNLGAAPQDVTLNLTVPSLHHVEVRIVTVPAYATEVVDYTVYLAPHLPAGKHVVLVNASSSHDFHHVERAFFIPTSRLRYVLDGAAYVAGDPLRVQLTNLGGVDTTYAYSALLLDPYLDPLIEADASGTLQAGATTAFTHAIPSAAINGTYVLRLRVDDLNTGATVQSYEHVSIDGVAAALAVHTDRAVYTVDELVALRATVTNLGDAPLDATLQLQILSSQPLPPTFCVIPTDDLHITKDTTLCPGYYAITDVNADGVLIIDAHGVTLTGNDTILSGSGTGSGIYNYGYANVTIRNLTVTDYDHGIYLRSAERNTVTGNNVSANDLYGLYLYRTKLATVTENTCSENLKYGIYLDQAENCTIESNTANGNFFGVYPYNSRYNTFVHNTANANTYYGFYAYYARDNVVTENTFVDTNIGVYLDEYTYDNTLSRNVINGSTYGFVFWDASSYDNVFVDNRVNGDVYYHLVGARDVVLEDLVLSAANVSNLGKVSLIDCVNVTLRNLTLTNSRHSGLFLYQSRFVTVVDSNFTANKQHGVYLEASHNNTFVNTTAATQNLGNGYGFFFYASTNNTVVDAVITENSAGVDLYYQAQYNTIANSTIDANDYGLMLTLSSTYNTIASNTIDGSLTNAFWFASNAYNNTVVDNRVDGDVYHHLVGARDVILEDVVSVAPRVSNLGKIALIDCVNVTLRNLTLANNNQHGLFLYRSRFTTVVNSTFTGNDYSGVYLSASHNTTVANITASQNRVSGYGGTGYGVYLSASHDTSITNTTATGNSRDGIYLLNSHGNTIANNTVRDNANAGVSLSTSHNTTIARNTVNGNGVWGIYLSSSDGNTITHNTASSNSYSAFYGTAGIMLSASDDNEVRANTASSNRYHGIWLYYAHNNTLTLNTAHGNHYDGIHILTGSDNEVTANTATSNAFTGLVISGSDNVVTNTTATANGDHGVKISGFTNLVTNTTCSNNNEYGIYLQTVSRDNVVTDNVVNGSGIAGFMFEADTYFNTIEDNWVDGDLYYHLVDAHDLVLEDLILSAAKVSNLGKISLINCTQLALRNLTLTNNHQSGLFLYQSLHVTITNVTAQSNRYGITLDSSTNITLTANTISANDPSYGYGISLTDSDGNTVTGNNATHNGHGLRLLRSNGNVLTNNIASYSLYPIQLYRSSDNVATNNTASSHSIYQSGILVQESSHNNTLVANTASANGLGIFVQWSSHNTTLLDNIVCSNQQYDIRVDTSSHDNSGENNTCGTTQNYDDDGATGCTYSCAPAPAPPQPASSQPVSLHPPLAALPSCRSVPSVEPASETADPPSIPVARVAYAPGAPAADANYILWDAEVPLLVVDTQEVTDTVGLLNVTGKLYLYAMLHSATGQIIATSTYPFYVTDRDYMLTLTTDQDIYTPGETVAITGSIVNTGATRTLTLTVRADGATILAQDVPVAADATVPFSTSVVANATFTLEGQVDGVTLTQLIRVEAPALVAALLTPEVVGRDPFDVTLTLENPGNVTADFTVQFDGDSVAVNMPPGTLTTLTSSLSITENTTVTVTITGDVARTLQQDVVYGEAATITVTPDDVYVEGPVTIPYTIRNNGVLDVTCTATFTVDGRTVTRDVYVPAGDDLTETLDVLLTRGRHLLTYYSPFWHSNATLHVESEPEFVLTAYPENLTADLGVRLTLIVTVRNVGGKAGAAQLRLDAPGLFTATNRTWLEGGQEGTLAVTVLIPDDVEERSYPVYLDLDGQRYPTTLFIRGATIAVDAHLDQRLYVDGDKVTLTLTVTNLRDLNLTLYSRVKLGDYDATQSYNLSALSTEQLTFTVPVAFEQGKLLYTVYMASGRSLYINALYVHPRSDAVILYTDAQVYEISDAVTVTVNASEPGRLVLSAPNLDVNTTVPTGVSTFTFDLPPLRSGTLPITYSFANYTATYPIDVIGYSARIIRSELDRSRYEAGDTAQLTLVMDANRDFSGVIQATIQDPDGTVVATGAVDQAFTAGENTVSMTLTVSTTSTGLHALGFEVYAYGSTIFLASGARYFDATYDDDTPPSITHTPVTSGVVDTAILVYALVTDDVAVEEVALYYRHADTVSFTRLPMPACAACIDTYNATIPAAAVTADLEYYLNASDGVHVALDGTPAAPHPLTVNRYPTAVTLSTPTGVTHNSLTLTWTASDTADFANYTVYQSTAQGALGTAITTITDASSTTYTVIGVAPATTYHFTVRVTDTGGLSANSAQVSATTDAAPPPAEIPWLYVVPVIVVIGAVVAILFSRKGVL